MSSSYLAHNNFPSLSNQTRSDVAAKLPTVPRIASKPPVRVEIVPQTATFEKMLTEKQAAVVLNKPTETLKKWRQRNQGPRFKRYHDGSIRYPLSGLEQYIEECATGPTAREGKRA
jgi:hypothetical protein